VNASVFRRATFAAASFSLTMLTAWAIPASAADAAAAGAEAADTAAAHQGTTTPALSLRVPKEDLVSFASIPNDDTVAGEPGTMMYGPTLVGAVVGIIAHGMIESHQQAKEKKSKNALGDIVLAPYRPSLSHFTNAELMRRALDGLATDGGKVLIQSSERAGPGWLIECSPAFLMTQDARALVLQNSIVIHSPDAASPVTFKNVVEVVGRPRESVGADSENTWMIQDGALLMNASVDLLRESLSLALGELRGDFAGHTAAYRTVRYPRGGTEKMERAQVLRETRLRIVIKTLRGWIMSVPASADASDPPDLTARR
jgi:hypothetical protein